MCTVVIGGRGKDGEDMNWENPAAPMVLSLSSDGCVKAWDVMQVMTQWKVTPFTMCPEIRCNVEFLKVSSLGILN